MPDAISLSLPTEPSSILYYLELNSGMDNNWPVASLAEMPSPF